MSFQTTEAMRPLPSGADRSFVKVGAGWWLRRGGAVIDRDNLLSVSIFRKEIEHPLLRASADDSEARPRGGEPI